MLLKYKSMFFRAKGANAKRFSQRQKDLSTPERFPKAKNIFQFEKGLTILKNKPCWAATTNEVAIHGKRMGWVARTSEVASGGTRLSCAELGRKNQRGR